MNATMIEGSTLGATLETAVSRWGDRLFARTAERAVTYAEFGREVAQITDALLTAGVVKGDAVATCMDNTIAHLAAWLALGRIGAVEIPINTAFKGEILHYVLAHGDARAMFCQSTYLAHLEPQLPHLGDLRLVIVPDLDAPPTLSGRAVVGRAELDGYDGRRNPAAIAPVDLAQISYTSGTTGRSKGVLIPHNRIIQTARDQVALRAIEQSDVLYTSLPLFHNNARYLTVLPAILTGAQLSLGLRFSASGFWPQIRAHGATQFNYLGVMLAILNKQPPSELDGEHALRLGWGAGAPRDVAETFEARFGVPLVEGYGLTEGGIVLSNRLDRRRAGTCGLPVDGYEVELVDAWDIPVPVGEVGEIVIRSRRPYTTMLGYHKMPEESVRTLRNLYLHTGDLARRDEDGFFAFVDRAKDSIRRRGENISSQEIEAAVSLHPAVLECAALPVPSDVTEDDVMIVVYVAPGGRFTVHELAEHCSETMPAFWVPRYYRLSAAPLPRTPTNKIEKHKLRSLGVRDAFDRLRGMEPARTEHA